MRHPVLFLRPLLLLVDIVAEALPVVAEGEDAESPLVVFGIDAVVVGGFEEVDLRVVEVEGLAYACNL